VPEGADGSDVDANGAPEGAALDVDANGAPEGAALVEGDAAEDANGAKRSGDQKMFKKLEIKVSTNTFLHHGLQQCVLHCSDWPYESTLFRALSICALVASAGPGTLTSDQVRGQSKWMDKLVYT